MPTAPHTSQRFYTPPELAKLWGVKATKILAWIACGELRAINMATRTDGQPRWRIAIDEAERFTRSRSSSPPPKPLRRKAALAGKDYFA